MFKWNPRLSSALLALILSLLAAQAGYSASGLLEFLRTLSEAQAKPQNQRAFGQLLL